MLLLVLFLTGAVLSGVIGFGYATGVVAIAAKLGLVVFSGLAIVLLIAKPSIPHDG